MQKSKWKGRVGREEIWLSAWSSGEISPGFATKTSICNENKYIIIVKCPFQFLGQREYPFQATLRRQEEYPGFGLKMNRPVRNIYKIVEGLECGVSRLGIQKYFPFNQSMEVIGDTLQWCALTFSVLCVATEPWKLRSTSKLSYPDWVLRISIHQNWCELSDQLPSCLFRWEGFPWKRKNLPIINLGPGFDSNWVKLHDAS